MIRSHRQGAWARLILDAPASKNKLSIAMLRALTVQIRAHAGLGLARLAIHSSAADIFAAGADMNELLQLDPTSAVRYAALGQELMDAIEGFPCPVVALVAGPCFGGALDLTLACSEIWASKGTVLCHPGAHLGIMTGFGGTVRLAERLPPTQARFMLLTGYRMAAEEAHRLGLVSRLFDSHKSMINAYIEGL